MRKNNDVFPRVPQLDPEIGTGIELQPAGPAPLFYSREEVIEIFGSKELFRQMVDAGWLRPSAKDSFESISVFTCAMRLAIDDEPQFTAKKGKSK